MNNDPRDEKWYDQPVPKYLYRYLPLRNDDDRKRAEAVVLRGELLLSTVSRFNDPFDCCPIGHAPKSRFVRERLIKAAQDRNDGRAVPPDRKLALIKSQKSMASEVASTFQRVAEDAGLLCFSECEKDVLMWSHYAANHTGLVLRFNIDEWPHAEQPLLLKVGYSDERPTVHIFRDGVSSDEVVAALTTKALFWEYEKEWRLIVQSHASRTINIPQRCVDAVILGFRTSNEDKLLVRSWKTKRHSRLDIFRATVSETRYELSVETA